MPIVNRAILLVVCVAMLGCQSATPSKSAGGKIRDFFDLNKGMPWHKDDEPQVKIPVRMVDVWTSSVKHTPGEKSQRGFGGRVHFYGPESNEPILVDGQLVVYAFDEEGRKPTDNRPTRRYVFPPEQFQRHMSESKLGPSYSFWLPWDEFGGTQTEISLICRFEPKGGTLIVGQQSSQLLNGTMVAQGKQEKRKPGAITDSGVRQAVLEDDSMGADHTRTTFESPMPAQNAPQDKPQQERRREQMTTTSISLPSRFGRHNGAVH